VRAGVAEEPATDVPTAAIPADVSRSNTLYVISAVETGEVELSQCNDENADGSSRWLLAIIVAVGSAIACPVGRLSPVQSWLASQGHLLLAVAGVVWWILVPTVFGWLGWLAVLTAAGLAMRPPWRTAAMDGD
jgi:hypothetical protein